MNTRLLVRPLALASVAVLAFGCQNGGGTSPTEPAPVASLSSSVAIADDGAAGGEESARGAGRAARVAELEGVPADSAEGAAEAPGAALVAAARGGQPGGNGGGNGGGKPDGAGNGNGNGNGNGGNGGGGGRGNGGGGALALEMQPNTWNTNWTGSNGTVSALIRGGDARDIDPDSVEMVCEGGETVAPVRVQGAGGQLRAFFMKGEAFECLEDPDPREIHEVTIRFTVDGGDAQELTANVRIVGPPGGGDDEDDSADEVNAEVQPHTWNVNWVNAEGTVSIVLRGDITDVDLDSIVLVGSAGTEVPPTSVRRVGNHVRARFPMDDAFLSLDDPDAGETHEITVKFDDEAGDSHEIKLRVRIVGPR